MTKQTSTPDAYPNLTQMHLRAAETGGLRHFHLSTEAKVVQILAAVPDYVASRKALVDLVARLDRLHENPTRLEDAADVLARALARFVDAGEPLPESLLDLVPDLAPVPVYEGLNHELGITVVANGHEVLMAQVEEKALRGAIRSAQSRLDSVLHRERSAICARLTDRLVEIVAKAREQLTARGRMDADQAIAEGRVAEFKAAEELGREYAEIRNLQKLWEMSHGTVQTDGPAYKLHLANPLEVFPHLARVETGVQYEARPREDAFLSEFARRGNQLPWPNDWAHPDAIWWFAEHPTARPWVPTPGQYMSLVREVDAAKTNHNRGHIAKEIATAHTLAGRAAAEAAMQG